MVRGVRQGLIGADPQDDRVDYGCDQDHPPIPTPHCLQQFEAVVARKTEPKEGNTTEREKHKEVLKRLRAWRDWQLSSRISRITMLLKRPWDEIPHRNLPRHEEIINMVLYFYPPRAKIKIFVCDFGLDRFEKQEVSLSTVVQCKWFQPFSKVSDS